MNVFNVQLENVRALCSSPSWLSRGTSCEFCQDVSQYHHLA